MNKRVEYYIQYIFDRMDINSANQVNLHAFKAAIELEPDLLEIFDFLNKGVTENLKNFDINVERREQKIALALAKMESKLISLVSCIHSDEHKGKLPPTINTNLPMEGCNNLYC